MWSNTNFYLGQTVLWPFYTNIYIHFNMHIKQNLQNILLRKQFFDVRMYRRMKHTFYIHPMRKNKRKSSMQTDYVETGFVSFIQWGTLVQYCFKASSKQVIYKFNFLLMSVTTTETKSSFNTILTPHESYSYYWEVKTV